MLARRWFVPVIMLALLGSALGPAASSAEEFKPQFLTTPSIRREAPQAAYVPGQVLVRLRDNSQVSAKGFDALKLFQSRFPSLHINATRALLPGTFRLDVASGADIKALARQMAAHPDVAYAEPNYLRYAFRGVNDPLSTFQYALNKINAYGAWDVTTGGPVTIAVLDSGVNAGHVDLGGRVLPGRDLVNDDDDPSDDVFHGTQVAGIIAASGDNGEGVAGVCWGCRILPVKVLNSRGAGSDETIAQGIRWAADNGARVINLSLGGPEDSQVIHEAVQYATSKNVLMVVAAGNSADQGNPVEYPAAYDEVFAVGATDDNDQHAFFSEAHPYVDVSAPGWNVATTANQRDLSGYGADSGTSFSAPYVAGLAGLLLSVNPNLDVNALRALIANNADDLGRPGPDPEFGAGRINAARAVAAVRVPAFEPAANPNQSGVTFFGETRHTLRGALKAYWEQNGGLPVFGFPISEEFTENTPEGAFTVQYFERNRLELHPDKPAPYNVLLGRLSDTLLQRQGRNWFTFPKGQQKAGCQLFAETGHSVCEPFLGYWKRNGLRDAKLTPDGRSLALFGLPLSEPAEEVNSSGEKVVTQWFERARFELHPDKAPQFQVLLGLLGNESGRPGAAGPAPSGQSPASRCDGVPASIDATVQPSGCVLPGTYITVDAFGFTGGEKAAFYYTAAGGEAVAVDDVTVKDDGHIRGIINVAGLRAGYWALVFRGNSSGHQSTIYLKVVDR
jgi:subtilisin family serine protease